MGFLNWFFIIPWVLLVSNTHQLQPSQTQILLQISKQLEHPSSLQILENYSGDICTIPSSPRLSIACEGSFVVSLKITGDYKLTTKESGTFNGYSIPNFTLSESFSIDSFVTTLTRLNNLKALSLVSLGIWGRLPDKIHRLSSLELLDLSSNFVFGSIPQLSRVSNLQSLALDSNFFNGTVPSWLGSLSNLTVLSLKNNHLTGEFPFSISRMGTLTDLALAHNAFSGKVPNLNALHSLHLLDLRDNKFDGIMPIMPKSLTTILLSKNVFSGTIPEEFGKLHQLQYIDLSLNHLRGTPPSSLFSLPNISYLNLASNELSGTFSDGLSCGAKLGFVDISSNNLIGSVPSCLANTSNDRVVKFEWNCFSVGFQHQHSDSYCKEVFMKRGRPKWKEIWFLIGVIGGLIFAIVFAVGLLILYRRYRLQEISDKHMTPKASQETPLSGISSELLANARLIAQAAKLGTQGVSIYRPFTLDELEEATDNFHKSMFLGEGTLGKVYKGKLENGTCVAIRSLVLLRKVSIRNLNLRLDLLSKFRHPHLVGLLGHCVDSVGPDDANVNRLFLVYEYIPSGDFRSLLSENFPEKALSWSDRLAVLIGVAKAVHYLHTGVISVSFSNKLKTNDILLDEHRIAKLSDYGMSVITEDFEQLEGKGDNHKSWHMTKLEDDVYKFGFILLESLVGPIVSSKGESFLLNEMSSFGSLDGRRRIVDPVVLTTSCQESLSIVVSITNKCIAPESSARPSFEDVLWNLQYAAQVQATSEFEQKSDATSQS